MNSQESSPTRVAIAESGEALSDRLDELLERWELLRASTGEADIAALCDGDPALTSELEALVQELTAVESTLARPLEEPVPPQFVSWGNRLRLLRQLGKGGQGSVYLAQDETLKRYVAVKTSHWRDPESELRLRKEGEIAARLDYPGVVTILGWGVTEVRLPFLVMKYVPGETLSELLETGVRDVSPNNCEAFGRKALTALRETCVTAHYAHLRGILHCDLKPQNILLSESGETVVLDWGASTPFKPAAPAAKLLEITRSSLLYENAKNIGTDEFMSPERLAGATDLGATSDVYSLGAILHRLIRGPARGSQGPAGRTETGRSLGLDQMLAPAAVSRLGSIADWACDEEPARRLDSAMKLADAIDSVLHTPLIQKRSFFSRGLGELIWRRPG